MTVTTSKVTELVAKICKEEGGEPNTTKDVFKGISDNVKVDVVVCKIPKDNKEVTFFITDKSLSATAVTIEPSGVKKQLTYTADLESAKRKIPDAIEEFVKVFIRDVLEGK